MKGRNADQTGQVLREMWDSFDCPVAIGADASRFDQSVSPEMLAMEHSVYLHVYNNCPELSKLLSWQINNRGFARTPDGVVHYKVKGSRMSGDMNTGSGNCLIMCCVAAAFFRWLKDEHGVVVRWRLANNGDDCVFILELKDAHVMDLFPQFCAGLGFKMEMEAPVSVFEEIEFCQTHPVQMPGGWRMVRNLENTLAKDLVSTKPIHNERSWNMFRGAISDCGAALCSGVPIYQDFYQYLGRGAEGVRGRDDGEVTGMMNLSRGMRGGVAPIADITRVSFWRAFGVNPGRQVVLEEHYANLHPRYQKPERVHHFTPNPALFAL
jgi:hypothetical protein